MTTRAGAPKEPSGAGNNIGFLRLVLAAAVIIGHAPELIDGNRGREFLAQFFPGTSLGIVAVQGFFLLSGYLIAKSMLKLNDATTFFSHRVKRIVPGFIVAYFLSVAILAPIMGVDLSGYMTRLFTHALFLHEPPTFDRDIAIAHHTVNGALWTISFELRCYIAVAALWATGLLRRRWAMVGLTAGALLLTVMVSFDGVRAPLDGLSHGVFELAVGTPSEGICFFATFLVGVLFYLFRDAAMKRVGWISAVAGVGLWMGASFVPHLSTAAEIVFLSAPVFWLAFKARLGRLQAVNSTWDISYGTYLYGWPIATALLFFNPGITPAALAATGLPLALLAGAASWWGIERWAKDWNPRSLRLARA